MHLLYLTVIASNATNVEVAEQILHYHQAGVKQCSSYAAFMFDTSCQHLESASVARKWIDQSIETNPTRAEGGGIYGSRVTCGSFDDCVWLAHQEIIQTAFNPSIDPWLVQCRSRLREQLAVAFAR